MGVCTRMRLSVFKSQDNETEQRTAAQAAWTTASTERRVHRTAHFVAARIRAACAYSSAFRRKRLTQRGG